MTLVQEEAPPVPGTKSLLFPTKIYARWKCTRLGKCTRSRWWSRWMPVDQADYEAARHEERCK